MVTTEWVAAVTTVVAVEFILDRPVHMIYYIRGTYRNYTNFHGITVDLDNESRNRSEPFCGSTHFIPVNHTKFLDHIPRNFQTFFSRK